MKKVIASKKRCFLVFPKALVERLQEKTNLAVTGNPYATEFALLESRPDSLDHLKNEVLEPIAEFLDVPMVTMVVKIEIPGAQFFPPGDLTLFEHEYVWNTLKKNDSLTQITDNTSVFDFLLGIVSEPILNRTIQ